MTGPTLDQAREVAASRFRVTELYPEQVRILESVLSGRDTLAVLPTGAGKSLCYQVPAMLAGRPSVTISPLIALMRDQEKHLERAGAPVVRLDSTLKVSERRTALARIEQGGALVVLTTPETMESPDLLEALVRSGVALFTVDEAHCVSEWGHDFRPAYLRLGAARAALGSPPALALTATATSRMKDDIQRYLKLDDPAIITAPPHRPNLRLEVEHVPGDAKLDMAGHILRRLSRPGIVYCATTVAVDQIYAALVRARIPATRYHGKMRAADRELNQKSFMKTRRRRVMVATTAFGMGIDKPNIRYIAHYQFPGSLEQYVQEAGRAGRDGRPSTCVLLYDPADMKIQEHLLGRDRPSPRQLKQVFDAFAAWVKVGRPVTAKDLALSARVQAVTARAGLAALEEVGVVEDTGKGGGGWVSRFPEETFANACAGLIERWKVLRMGDEMRLRAVAMYATQDGCRSAFLRGYFGEESPPDCGNCDRCDPRPRHIRISSTVQRKRHRDEDRQPGRKRRKRSRGRGKGSGTPVESKPVVQAPDQARPGEGRRRRRRRRRRGKGQAKSQE